MASSQDLVLLIVVSLASLAMLRVFGAWSLRGLAILLLLFGLVLRWIVLARIPDAVIGLGVITRAQFSQASLAAFVGVIGLLAGFVIWSLVGGTVGASASAGASRVTVETPERAGGRAPLLAALLVLVLQGVLLTREFGSLESAVTALSRRNFLQTASAFTVNLSLVAAPLLILSILRSVLKQSRVGVLVSVICFAGFVPWVAVVNGRGLAVTFLWVLGGLLIRGRSQSARVVAYGVLAAVGSLVTIGGLAWRTAAQSGAMFSHVIDSGVYDGGLAITDALPLVDHFLAAKLFADVEGHDLGSSLIDAGTVLVPRSLFDGIFGFEKPAFLPERIAETVAGSSLSGLPGGLLGEGFIAFGWFGVLVYSLVFGFLISWLDHALHQQQIDARAIWLTAISPALVLTGLRTGAQGALILAQIALLMHWLLYFPLVVLWVGGWRRTHRRGALEWSVRRQGRTP